MTKHEFYVNDSAHTGMRADRFIAEVMGFCTRSQLKSLTRELAINDVPVKPSHHLKTGDRITLAMEEPSMEHILPEPLPLSILYEDENVVVIDKPQGMTVHPGAGKNSGTLVQGLMYHVRGLTENFEDSVRPGIVHRLDMDTSGVIITAKNARTHDFLAKQFSGRKTRKKYIALVMGRPAEKKGTIAENITRDPKNRKRFTVSAVSGKPAKTNYRVLRQFKGYALLSVEPVTGRTHQIRVHLLSRGMPVVGDRVYGRKKPLLPEAGLMLHALSLAVTLPGETSQRVFRSPLPLRFYTYAGRIKSMCL